MDPATLMGQVDANARALDTAGSELGKAIKVLQQRELAYDEAHETALIEIFHEHKESGERQPGETTSTRGPINGERLLVGDAARIVEEHGAPSLTARKVDELLREHAELDYPESNVVVEL